MPTRASLNCIAICASIRQVVFAVLVLAGTVLITTMLTVPLWVASASAASFLHGEIEARNDPSALFFTPACNAKLSGFITGPDPGDEKGHKKYDGDAKKIETQLKDFEAKAEAEGGKPAEGKFYALCLDSGGGDLDEAMKIATLFKGWMMVVEAEDECISACSVIFMSAAPRDRVFGYSGKSPGRFLHHNGLLGFHSPRLNFPASEAKNCTPIESASRAEKAYADALASMRAVAFPSRSGATSEASSEHQPEASGTMVETKEGVAYVEYEIEDFVSISLAKANTLPPDLLAAFLTVPPGKVLFVRYLHQAVVWEIEVYGIAPPPSLSEAMLTFGCLNVAAMQCLKDGECGEFIQDLRANNVTPAYFSARFDLSVRALALMSFVGLLEPEDFLATLQFRVPDFSKYGISNDASGAVSQGDNVQALQLYEPKTDQPICDIRATWASNRLAALHLDLVALKPPGQRLLALPANMGSDWNMGQGLHRYRFNPVKTLPIFKKLVEFGESNPWGDLANGGDALGEPPNWAQSE